MRFVVLLSLVALAAGPARAGSSNVPMVGSHPACQWRVVPTPVGEGQLEGVSGTSADDVWAVGHSTTEFDMPPIILHWDGRQWSNAPKQPSHAWLFGVSSLSPSDAWAVGYEPLLSGDQPLTMHWNGMFWRVVPTQDFTFGARLQSVSARGSRDVWAVGYWAAIGAIHPLVLHWDGTSWTQVPAPDADSNNNQLESVTAVAADDVWAVGFRDTETFYTFGPLIEHWDGTAWSVVSSPSALGSEGVLSSVSGTSGSNVWAVGNVTPDAYPAESLIEHWDGTRWRLVPHSLRPRYSGLLGVSALSADDAWAVGGYTDIDGPTGLVLTEHWDGSRWTVVDAPSPGSDATLYAVDAISEHDIWAVGARIPSQITPLIMHSFGC